MSTWNKVADDSAIEKTITNLKANGFEAIVVENGEEAKTKVLEILPKEAEVLTVTSITTESIGLSDAINNSGAYDSVRKDLEAMDRKTQGKEMQRKGTAPDWVVGSIHALTQEGQALIASNTGSQLPAYVYGAHHVVWVVGAQKIVTNLEEGKKRLYEHALPLESVRARKAYGLPNDWDSFISKLLIYSREPIKGRVTVVIVKESLGH